MSRYSHNVVRDGAEYVVSYGYDRPLSEYFIHVEHANATHSRESEEDDNPELLFAVSSYSTLKPHPDHPGKYKFSNSELLELFKEWGVPEKHISQLALDLPF